MRRYSEALKNDVRRRMNPPHRQSMPWILEELGIHVITLYKWRKAWRLQGEVVPASEKDPEGWTVTDKFAVVLETAGLNATVTASKDDAPAAVQAAMANVAGLESSSGGGGLIQTTSG